MGNGRWKCPQLPPLVLLSNLTSLYYTLKWMRNSQFMEARTPLTSQSITYSRIVDLSHAIAPNIPIWPCDPPVEFESVAQIPMDGYFLRKFAMGEHSGTHINAPKTFDPNSSGIECYSPQSLVVSAVVIDICIPASLNPDYLLRIADIENWEQQYGKIPKGSLVILYTGWQNKWQNPPAFFNADAQGQLHFPGFGSEVIKFLLSKREIAGVGIDTHGVDSGGDHSFMVNKMLLLNSGIVLENLTNLDQLPPTGITLVIGILRLKGGSGSPVSVIAFLP